jgi:hypothetical protein
MEQLAELPEFQAVNDEILHVSRSANRVICYIRADFEWRGGVLKDNVFNETFDVLKKYRRHFHAMPEAQEIVEDIAWRLLHTQYWQAYFTHYARLLPSRAAFHARYFVQIPGKAKKDKRGKPQGAYAVIPGIVYLIEAQGTGCIKIGRGESALARRENLQTGCPFALHILREIKTEDAAGLERMLHARYDPYKTIGEWFDLPADILNALLKEVFHGF